MLNLIWIIPLLPVLGTLVNGIAGLFLRSRGRQLNKQFVATVAVGVCLVAFACSLMAIVQLQSIPSHAYQRNLFTWIPGLAVKTSDGALAKFEIPWGFQLDPLSAIMILVVTGVGSLIHIYAVGYMWDDGGFYRFFAYLNLFMFAMLTLVLANNFLLMFVGWEGVGLCSYLLIGFYLERKSAGDAAKKAFVVNRVGDFGFALGMMLIFSTFGSLDYQTVFERVGRQFPGPESGFGVVSWMALLLFIGATGKSAQIPLYVWLPDAMEGPTPVSALIHAATMVTAGVYMVVRTNALYSRAPQVMWMVAVVGIATALFSASIGLVQRDIKRVLAYSTVSQLGYMFTALGVGAFAAGIFHLMTHAFFKALLFLGSGSVIHALHHEQDLFCMGGLKKYLPWTCATMWIGTLALAGVPLLSGFFSKDEILWRTYHNPGGSAILWVLGVLTAGLTAFYMFRLMFLTFHGEERFRSPGIGHRSSVIGHRSSVNGDQSSVIGHRSSVNGDQSSVIGHRSSVDQKTSVSRYPAPGPRHPTPDTRHLTPDIHPHESPWIMVGPLVVLAVFSVVAGYVMVPTWFPIGGQWFDHFLEPVFAQQHVAGTPERMASQTQEIALAGVSVLVALAGMALAYVFYIVRPQFPTQWATRFRLLYNTLYNKYYVDQVYDAAIVHPIERISESFLWKGMDVSTIDGAVNGVASMLQAGADLFKRMQSGYARAYGTWILFGAFLVLLYLVGR